MRLKKGDKVIVITGSNKGREGIIKQVLRDSNKVIVEGVNIVKKHRKATNQEVLWKLKHLLMLQM